MATLDFLKELKDLKKAEIWGIIIIAAFNLSTIIAALTHLDKLGANNLFIFFGALQVCLTPLYVYLFYLYGVRLGFDDMHEAVRNIHTTMKKTNEQSRITLEMMQSSNRAILEALQRIESLKKDINYQK